MGDLGGYIRPVKFFNKQEFLSGGTPNRDLSQVEIWECKAVERLKNFIQGNKKKLILVAAFAIALIADSIFPGVGIAISPFTAGAAQGIAEGIDLLFLLWELWQLSK